MDMKRSRFRGCLMGVAIGDAFGAPFEGAGAVSHAQWLKLAEGSERLRFTDDTHMTFGMIESLLATDGFDPDHTARIFARDYESEPWRGYGAGPPQIFARIAEGATWQEAAQQVYPGGSFGNGGAMRVAPVGLYFHTDLERAAEVGRQSAAITHAHQLGQEGAAAQSVAIAYLVSQQQPLVPENLTSHVAQHLRDERFRDAIMTAARVASQNDARLVATTIGNGITAIEAVPAALASFVANIDSFEATVGFAIKLGGDTDTIASMAAALSGAYLGDSAIPRQWAERAEGARSMGRLAGILLDRAAGGAIQ